MQAIWSLISLTVTKFGVLYAQSLAHICISHGPTDRWTDIPSTRDAGTHLIYTLLNSAPMLLFLTGGIQPGRRGSTWHAWHQGPQRGYWLSGSTPIDGNGVATRVLLVRRDGVRFSSGRPNGLFLKISQHSLTIFLAICRVADHTYRVGHRTRISSRNYGSNNTMTTPEQGVR